MLIMTGQRDLRPSQERKNKRREETRTRPKEQQQIEKEEKRSGWRRERVMWDDADTDGKEDLQEALPCSITPLKKGTRKSEKSRTDARRGSWRKRSPERLSHHTSFRFRVISFVCLVFCSHFIIITIIIIIIPAFDAGLLHLHLHSSLDRHHPEKKMMMASGSFFVFSFS